MRILAIDAAVIAALSMACALPVATGAAAADIAFGEYLASECVTCHRADGQNKGIPSIVGWREDEFVSALEAYRSKDRPNLAMQTIAGRLSAPEMAALAAYFARLSTR